MRPLQEIWIGEDDDLSFQIVGDWFSMSRGTLLMQVQIDPQYGGREAILRQHGGEDLWYTMIASQGTLDDLEGTAWYAARDEDGRFITIQQIDPEDGEDVDE